MQFFGVLEVVKYIFNRDWKADSESDAPFDKLIKMIWGKFY